MLFRSTHSLPPFFPSSLLHPLPSLPPSLPPSLTHSLPSLPPSSPHSVTHSLPSFLTSLLHSLTHSLPPSLHIFHSFSPFLFPSLFLYNLFRHYANAILSLHSVLNGRISRELGFENTFVPPGPGDEGVAVGCALYGLQVSVHIIFFVFLLLHDNFYSKLSVS